MFKFPVKVVIVYGPPVLSLSSKCIPEEIRQLHVLYSTLQ